jgi:hypothetical protein
MNNFMNVWISIVIMLIELNQNFADQLLKECVMLLRYLVVELINQLKKEVVCALIMVIEFNLIIHLFINYIMLLL